MNKLFILILLFATPLSVQAGIHSSLEPTNPFPSKWRGFLPDHRNLRMIAIDPATKPGMPISPLREAYTDLVLTLDAASKSRALTAKEAVDFSAAYVRLGQPEKAIAVLRTSRRQYPDDFKLAANLGTAYQLTGDLRSAEAALEDAVKLAPEKSRNAERYHLKLVRSRLKEGRTPSDSWDVLFEFKEKSYPVFAVEIVQQLALWLPADGRLLWQLGEIAHSSGDVRTAANILDGCVAEFGMSSVTLREHRTKYRTAAEKLAATEDHIGHMGSIVFASSRALGGTFDASKLPAIRTDRSNPLPWGALVEVTVGKGFKPTYLKHIDSLDGNNVTVTGYPASAGDGADGASFLLTEFPIGCWFCESPDATGIIRIELAPGGDATAIPRGSIKLTGKLKLNRTDPERFLYTIENAKLAVTD